MKACDGETGRERRAVVIKARATPAPLCPKCKNDDVKVAWGS